MTGSGKERSDLFLFLPILVRLVVSNELSHRAPVGFPFRFTQATKWSRSSRRSRQGPLQIAHVCGVVRFPFIGAFLRIRPLGGILEAITTPLTAAKRRSKSGVVTIDFIVLYILSDMAVRDPVSAKGAVRREGLSNSRRWTGRHRVCLVVVI